jgi:hypothetical protein
MIEQTSATLAQLIQRQAKSAVPRARHVLLAWTPETRAHQPVSLLLLAVSMIARTYNVSHMTTSRLKKLHAAA